MEMTEEKKSVKKWENVLKKEVKTLGIYQKSFDMIISECAKVQTQKERAYKQFIEGGSKLMIEQPKNAKGLNVLIKNPLLTIWEDLEKQSVLFLRELGLTPLSIKKINDSITIQKELSPLEKALIELSEDMKKETED